MGKKDFTSSLDKVLEDTNIIVNKSKKKQEEIDDPERITTIFIKASTKKRLADLKNKREVSLKTLYNEALERYLTEEENK